MISMNIDIKLHNVYQLSLIMPIRTNKLLVIIFKYLLKKHEKNNNLTTDLKLISFGRMVSKLFSDPKEVCQKE